MSASLSNEEIEDRYFLLGQIEILQLLNKLAHRREPVSVYFNAGQNFILTVLLSARPDGLVFDIGGDPRNNKMLEKAQQCTFMSFPDGIRVQFTCLMPQRFTWGDDDAFWCPVPERVVRLQRRESYRNKLPISHALKARLSDEDGKLFAEWNIHDISVGGFGVIVDGQPHLLVDELVSQVWINLSSHKNVHCPVIVRHITPIDRARTGKYQVGFGFVDLPHNMDIAVQRVILNLEYERHRLLGN